MNGLILIGGHSSRMGSDKSLLVYHQQPQWQHLVALLSPRCEQVYVCGRKAQFQPAFENYWLLDPYEIGPLGGILTALEYNAEVDWLVVACDMPFVNDETIDFLQQNHSQNTLATAFLSPSSRLPEPLLAIWGATSRAVVQEAFARQQHSPMMLLRHPNVHLLECPQPIWLRNINTPEDYQNPA